jgi:hypothetical protein
MNVEKDALTGGFLRPPNECSLRFVDHVRAEG